MIRCSRPAYLLPLRFLFRYYSWPWQGKLRFFMAQVGTVIAEWLISLWGGTVRKTSLLPHGVCGSCWHPENVPGCWICKAVRWWSGNAVMGRVSSSDAQGIEVLGWFRWGMCASPGSLGSESFLCVKQVFWEGCYQLFPVWFLCPSKPSALCRLSSLLLPLWSLLLCWGWNFSTKFLCG